MRFLVVLLLAFGAVIQPGNAQTAPDFWKEISPDHLVTPEGSVWTAEPLKFKAFSLDFNEIDHYLRQAPREFTSEAKKHTFTVVIPGADGRKEAFAVAKTRVMAAELEAAHPEIGTYSGVSLQDPGKQVRITVTPTFGFSAMILRSDRGIEYVEPVTLHQTDQYLAYDRQNLPAVVLPGGVHDCGLTHDEELDEIEKHPGNYNFDNARPENSLQGDSVKLKIYRFACSTTGEFSQDVGTTKDQVFQKITMVTNKINAITERDINNRLELIAKSYDIIFMDPATDPFSGSDVSFWMNQNPDAISGAGIALNEYDLGHAFGKYVSGSAIGIANLSCCCNSNKGRASSSDYGPTYGDYFVSIAAHEMGHQWSATHTYNQCTMDSPPSPESTCEPGSGNSLMSYHGSCSSNDTEGDRYLYYHACSMAQIRHFVAEGSGATCGTTLPVNNTTPVLSTSYPPVVYIPISTPFELTGNGVDAEDSNITYSWDQINTGPSTPLGSPILDAASFRYFQPSATPTRTFPKIQNIVANISSSSEVLPTYSRDLDFVLVARDNHTGGGGVVWDTVKLRAVASAGPFLVTYPDTAGLVWNSGEYQTITWDVANTDKSPVSAAKVDIKLVQANFPQNTITYLSTLAEEVPNTGKYCIQVPNVQGTNFRIRIEASAGVFFDLSNENFTIQAPTAPGFSLCAGIPQDQACLPQPYTQVISTSSLLSFSDPVTLSAIGLPQGATATFDPNPVVPGANSAMTITFPAGMAETNFDLQIAGVSGVDSATTSINLNTINNDFSAFSPLLPVNGATGVSTQPALFWNTVPAGDTYEVQLATSPSFEPATIVASKLNVAVDSFQITTQLQEGHVYYWRVRPYNECGSHEWTKPQVFVVLIQNCLDVEAGDLPKNISANGTPTVESKITVNANTPVSSLTITKIQGTHQFFKDLEAHLISPAGTDILLWKDKCGAFSGNFNFGMADGGVTFSCPPSNNGTLLKPTGSLSSLNGQLSGGDWILRVKDNAISSGGSLLGFAFKICAGVALNPPTLVVNNPLSLPSGTNAPILDNLLSVTDPDDGPDQLIYTLVTLPEHGLLQVNGINAVVGNQFTQQDISNGGLRYFDYGLNLGQDDFYFSVTDGDGGLVSGDYLIEPVVSTHTPVNRFGFDLAPNPASGLAVLTFAHPLESDARVTLLNTAGQTVRSWQAPAGAYSLRLPLQGVPKGVYVVAIENAAMKGVKKLLVH